MIGSSGMGLLNQPVVCAAGQAAAMRREKSTAMLPKQRPKLIAVGLRQRQLCNLFAREKCKATLTMRGGQAREAGLHFKEEHQPMRLATVAVFAYQASEVQVGGLNFDAEFLGGFAARRRIWRLTARCVELPAARAP